MNGLFIDISNLNTLYKVDGKFCLGVNYSSCASNIVIDAQALGSSFDVYLSLLPRIKEEGDAVIQALSIGQVPFYVQTEEVDAAFALVEKIPGVNNIYLCNALANFLLPARVSNYNAVLCYGSRYAFVEVTDRMLASFRVFNTQREFYAEMGEEYTCYGDMDLVDVEKLRSWYPELVQLKNNVLVPLVSLVTSYRSTYKVSIEEARHQMAVGIVAPEKQEPVEVPATREEAPELPDYNTEELTPKDKKHRDWVVGIAGLVATVAFVAAGVGYQLRDLSSQIATYNNEELQYSALNSNYEAISNVYYAGYGTAGKGSSVLTYIRSSDLAVQIVASEIYSDRQIIRFSCDDSEIKDNLVAYLQQKYTVGEVNELGTSLDADHNTLFEYGITVVY